MKITAVEPPVLGTNWRNLIFLKIKTGYFYPPEGPGLGVSLSEDLIREHPRKDGFFNMWEAHWHMRQFAK